VTQAELLLGVLILFAAFAQGVLGFGFGLILMAVLPHFVPFKAAVPFVAIFGLCMNAFLLVRYRRSVRKGPVFPIIAGGLAGVPLGVALLHTQSSLLLERILGVVIVIAALWSLFGTRIAKRKQGEVTERSHAPSGALAGLLGGVLGGGFNIGGPPIVIYGAWARWSPRAFRGTIQAFFFVLAVLQITLLGSTELLNVATVRSGLPYLPVLALGAWLGAATGDRLRPDWFAQLILWALVLLGVLYFLR